MATERILIVDDEEHMRHLLTKMLTEQGYVVEVSADGDGALRRLREDLYDMVITDIRMPGLNGMELLEHTKVLSPETIIIIMTAFGSVDSAVQAIKNGAYHYITKPFKMEEILVLVRKGMEDKRLRREVTSLREEVSRKYEFGNLIGKSKQMQDIFQLIRRVAHTNSTILIQGESGTGKELVAKAIHYNSPRKEMPLVVVNCSAIPETLLESELFGHVKGSFTGAIATRKGLFEEAHRGSIFLDEVAEVPPSIQVKLLRVLQEREIRRVGGSENIAIDVRLMAATNKTLEEAVRAGEFRDDLFYRLNVIPIHLPGLRDRPEDIPLLVGHFLKKFSTDAGSSIKGISREALNLLMNYSWPGNVRELENAIERAVALGTHTEITPEDLPPAIRMRELSYPRDSLPAGLTLQELERDYITKVMERTGGHQIKAAKVLGIDRRTLYRKLIKYGLKR